MNRSYTVLLAAVCVAAGLLMAQRAPVAPEQPIPYSHKQHIALGLKCKDCHVNPEPGEMMTFPATSKCMACHATIKTDSPAIAKLAAHAQNKKPVPWVRVYQIPSYVDFSHRVHIEAGGKCEQCHGPVAERTVLAKEQDISMGACMDCHRVNKVSNDCMFCHLTR